MAKTCSSSGDYNFGDMSTQGVEVSLNTKNIVTDNFEWKTTFTVGALQQKITRLLNTPNTFDMVAGTGKGNLVGYPRGSLFSFVFKELNSDGLPTFDFGNYPFQNMPFQTIAGADFLDTQYSKSYLTYHGPIEPNVTGGLSNSFKYKNIELSVFITFQGGNKIRLRPSYDKNYDDLNVFSKSYNDRWLMKGDETRTNVPVIPSLDLINTVGDENIQRAYNTYNYSQLRVANGGFIRMKNISLAYSFSNKQLNKYGLKGLTIRTQVTNPFLIFAAKELRGQDPEFYVSGGVSMPSPTLYTLTFNITL